MASSSLSEYSTAEIEYELWRRYASHIRFLHNEIQDLRGVVEDLVLKVKLERINVDDIQLPKTRKGICSQDELQSMVASLRKESAKTFALAYYAWVKGGRKGREPEAECSERLANQIRSRIFPSENPRPLGEKFTYWA